MWWKSTFSDLQCGQVYILSAYLVKYSEIILSAFFIFLYFSSAVFQKIHFTSQKKSSIASSNDFSEIFIVFPSTRAILFSRSMLILICTLINLIKAWDYQDCPNNTCTPKKVRISKCLCSKPKQASTQGSVKSKEQTNCLIRSCSFFWEFK